MCRDSEHCNSVPTEKLSFWHLFNKENKMARLVSYDALTAAVSSGSEQDVRNLLSRTGIDDIHGYLCEELPAENPARCVNCEHLLTLRQRGAGMMKLLLEHGVFPPFEEVADCYVVINAHRHLCFGCYQSATSML